MGDFMSYMVSTKAGDTPIHKHSHFEILIYSKGNGILQTHNQIIDVFPGKVAIIPPGTMHGGKALDTDFERIYIGGDFSPYLSLSAPIVISDNPSGEGLLLAKTIFANRHSNQDYLNALVNAFAHFLIQNIKMENEVFSATKSIVDKLSNDFFNSSINIRDILKNSGYAEDYIRAQFKKITGKTPNRFLTEIRINHACSLIDIYHHSLSLSVIAEKCGYTDYVYFSRRFKQIKGISPRQYSESTLLG